MARCVHQRNRSRARHCWSINEQRRSWKTPFTACCCLLLLSVPVCISTADQAQRGHQHGLQDLHQQQQQMQMQMQGAAPSLQQAGANALPSESGCRHSTHGGLSFNAQKQQQQQQQQQLAAGGFVPAFLPRSWLPFWQRLAASGSARALRLMPAAAAAAASSRRLAQYKPSSREQQGAVTGMPMWHAVGVAFLCLAAMVVLGFSAYKAMQWLERTRRPGYVELQAMDTAYHRPWATL